jgi:molybdopterin-guanine dinucleotide biosynthesis protein
VEKVIQQLSHDALTIALVAHAEGQIQRTSPAPQVARTISTT